MKFYYKKFISRFWITVIVNQFQYLLVYNIENCHSGPLQLNSNSYCIIYIKNDQISISNQ